VVPSVLEVIFQNGLIVATVSFNNLLGGSFGRSFVEEEVSGWLTLIILEFDGIILNKGPHESIVSFFTESLRQLSLISVSRSMFGFPRSKIINLTDLDILLVVRIGVRVNIHVVPSLNLGPVIVEMAGEGRVWMGVFRHWASDVRLWVFRQLELSPIVMQVGGESGVWVSILWHWASDIWLWVLASIQLNLSPVVVEVTGES